MIGNRIQWKLNFDIPGYVDSKSIKKIIEKVINNLCVNELFSGDKNRSKWIQNVIITDAQIYRCALNS